MITIVHDLFTHISYGYKGARGFIRCLQGITVWILGLSPIVCTGAVELLHGGFALPAASRQCNARAANAAIIISAVTGNISSARALAATPSSVFPSFLHNVLSSDLRPSIASGSTDGYRFEPTLQKYLPAQIDT